MKTNETKVKTLPKFDTPGWLSLGALFSLVLVGCNLWSAIARWHEPFFPFGLGEILGMIVGLVLGIHCIDMIAYHRRNRSFGKMR
jgi:hypothetical protein